MWIGGRGRQKGQGEGRYNWEVMVGKGSWLRAWDGGCSYQYRQTGWEEQDSGS